MLKKSATDKIC